MYNKTVSVGEAAVHMKDVVVDSFVAAEEKVLGLAHATGEKATEIKDNTINTAHTATTVAATKMGEAKEAA